MKNFLKLVIIFFILSSNASFSQSIYTNLKEYYQTIYNTNYKEIYTSLPFGCDSIPDNYASNLTIRACAVKEFIEQDSILCLYTDSVKQEIIKLKNTVLLQNFDSLQFYWNNYMVTQGYMIGEKYKSSFSDHTKSLFILNSHLFMIELRIKEMKELLIFYRNNHF